MPDLSAKAFRFLLNLVESEPPCATADIVTEEIGDALAAAVSMGLLVHGGNLDGVEAETWDGELRPILAFDGDTGTVTCFHPDAGFVAMPATALRTWLLDTARLAEFVGRLLGLLCRRRHRHDRRLPHLAGHAINPLGVGPDDFAFPVTEGIDRPKKRVKNRRVVAVPLDWLGQHDGFGVEVIL